MNRAEAKQTIGKTATIKLGNLTFEVIVKQVKFSYGRTRFKVIPKDGLGEMWTEKITLN